MLLCTTHPEAVLRSMLAQDDNLRSLEVRAAALEDTFLALTAQAR